VGEKQQPKLAVIVFTNTRSNPRTMMIEFSNTFTTIIAMLSSIFHSTIANLAKVGLLFLKAE
jgi:hypothetical protein